MQTLTSLTKAPHQVAPTAAITRTVSMQVHLNDQNVRKCFPEAMRNEDVVKGAIEITTKLGLDAANTLFSHSVCPDEINHMPGDITREIHNHFGKMFSLGGLAGLPFTGFTGFNAYAAHVPDQGNIFVLFAPHCGVSREGLCGYYHRHGQRGLTTACGAALGALDAVKDLKEAPETQTMSFDVQMDFIKRIVWQQRERITAAHEPAAEVTNVLYENARDYFLEVVQRRYKHPGKVVLLGGI